jgi:arylsulfatase A-like enzyme
MGYKSKLSFGVASILLFTLMYQNCSNKINKNDLSNSISKMDNSSIDSSKNRSNKIHSKPNFIVIMLDDQGAEYPDQGWRKNMKTLSKYISQKAVSFNKHFVSNSLCCPSRVTFLSGRYSHNSNVFQNNAIDSTGKGGGYQEYVKNGQGEEKNSIAAQLHSIGYETILLGKYLNGFPGPNLSYVPKGWDYWHGGFLDSMTCRKKGSAGKFHKIKHQFMFDPNSEKTATEQYSSWYKSWESDSDCSLPYESAYSQYNYSIVSHEKTNNGFEEYNGNTIDQATRVELHSDTEQDYLQDVLNQKAVAFFKNRNKNQAFFLYMGSYSSHGPYAYAKRYTNHQSIDKMVAPRTPNYRTGPLPWWLNSIPLYNDTSTECQTNPDHCHKDSVEGQDQIYRKRLKSLLAVDDGLEMIISNLSATELENTYFIFTADNGYHLGNHNLTAGKQTEMEEDLRIPLYIFGSKLQKNRITDITLNTDLAPTIAELAGLEPVDGDRYDGRSLFNYLQNQPLVDDQRDHILLEHAQRVDISTASLSGNSVIDGNDNSGSKEESLNTNQSINFNNLTYPAGGPPFVGLRTKRFMYVYYPQIKKANQTFEMEELYDLKNDQFQLNNIAFQFPNFTYFLKNHLKLLSKCKGPECKILENKNLYAEYLYCLSNSGNNDCRRQPNSLPTITEEQHIRNLIYCNSTEFKPSKIKYDSSCDKPITNCQSLGFKMGCNIISKGLWLDCINSLVQHQHIVGVKDKNKITFTREDALNCLTSKADTAILRDEQEDL